MKRFLSILLLLLLVFSTDAAVLIGRKIVAKTVTATGGTTLLLDESGLGSAAAAYSVRKLRAAYAGSALRVRRSSDSTEQDIGFSGNNLDTATLASFCSGTDGFVTKWYDQSGNARDAVQATAANQPKIVSSGTVQTGPNSKPVMSFDGSNDFLNTTWTQSQPVTVAFAGKGNTWVSGRYLYDGGTINLMALIQRTVTPNIQQYAGAFGNDNGNMTVDTYVLSSCIFNGASSVSQINAGSDVTSNPSTGAPGGVTIGARGGGASNSTLWISELVIWSSALGSTDRSTQRNNQNAYYTLY